MKTPSGNNHVLDDFFLAGGSAIQSPVDLSIQLGDGGLGVVLQAARIPKGSSTEHLPISMPGTF